MQVDLATKADIDELRVMMQKVLENQSLSEMVPKPEWLTISEAASKLRVSESTIRRRIDQGDLEAKGAGKLRRVFIPNA